MNTIHAMISIHLIADMNLLSIITYFLYNEGLSEALR